MAESSRAPALARRAHFRFPIAVVLLTVLACVLPTITGQPQSKTVQVGETATFTVTVTGTAPFLYQWTRDGAAIPGATSASYTTPATAAADDGAVFRVVVTNVKGSVCSDPATLTVLPVPVAPSIATQPQSQSVLAGQSATFLVVVAGTEPLSYQWTRNGAEIPGATSAAYTTPATTTADSGAVFRVVVRNAAGSVTSDPAALAVAFGVYRDGVVEASWAPQVWTACGTDNPNMAASFAGQTAALFDLSCAGGWTAGVFGHWNGKFDLSPYDTLSFDIGSDGDAGMASLAVWFDNNQSVAIGPVTAGRMNHVTISLKDAGLTGGSINQFGWFFMNSGPGPAFYVNDVAFSAELRPTTPPTISGLTVSSVEDYGATLAWSTDRACTAQITLQKSDGTSVTRSDGVSGTDHAFVLDSLEPSTSYAVTVVAVDKFGTASAPATATLTTLAANDTPTVTVTLDPAHPTPISPYVYGINGLAANDGLPSLLTIDRQGGNRLTAYNWENNASNAGSDWQYSSDGFLSSSTVPGEVVRSFIAADHDIGAASIVTLQMQGWVSADENGPVDMAQPLETRLATRFKQVVPKKSSIRSDAFTVEPPTGDAYVFMDELAWALDQKFAGQGIFERNAPLPTFVSLDNEPELWMATHEEVQGTTPESTDDYIQKTIALTRALKDQFPGVQTFGPVNYGFGGLYNFQNDSTLGGSTWFADKYLAAMKAASDAYGNRLLDVYDFHWYSESRGSDRVTGLRGPDLSDADVQAIVQSPRSLWDPTFSDSSDWISRDVLGGPIRILGRLQEKIDANYPGTRIAITEYENGGWNHIAGTIAQADDLGIFASLGVYAATLWPPSGTYDYALAGFRAFRGFDGGSAVFGDVSIPAISSDVSKVTVYASRDSAVPGRLVFVAINRSTATQKVAIGGQTLSGTATTYRMTAASAAAQVAAGGHVAPVLVGQSPVRGTSMLAVLPALSVTTIAVQ